MARSSGLLVLCMLMLALMKAVSSTAGRESCTENSCFPPFPYCDFRSDTQTCEALKWSRVYPGGWYSSQLSQYEDRFFDVVCSTDGDYPAADCNSFYRCQNGTATLQTCSSPGYPFFDPVEERCSNSKKCPTFDCFNKPNAKIALTGELTPFFSYCIRLRIFDQPQLSNYRTSNTVLPKVISRCFGKDTFNPNSRRCEPLCLQPGLIPDTTDCHKYFLCSLTDPINVTFFMNSLTCPQEEAFQESLFQCVPESLVPSCKSPFPGPI